MRKAFVAGVVSLGLLVGCNSSNIPPYVQPTAAEFCTSLVDDHKLLGKKRIKRYSRCLSEAKQPLAKAAPQMTQVASSNTSNKISGEALMRMGGAMYSCAIHGTTPDPVTGICSPPPPRQQGNVYDNSGRLIGTYVEN